MSDLRDAVREATARLADAGVPSPEHDAVALAAHALRVEPGEVRRLMVLGSPVPEAYAGLVAERAARAAHIEEFVERLPEGYDTILGERGARLSGGQKQRVAIARAFLKNPPILILDEATSALDTVTEHKVKQALEAASRGRTTFLIAHRLSTVIDADLIVVMDRGRIVEQGRYADLMAQGGVFWRLAREGGLAPPAASPP